MHNTIDFFKIDNGKLGAINFNNMIPLKEDNYKEINLYKKNFTKDDINYHNLLIDQLKWLNEHYIQIKHKSMIL